MSTQKLYTSLKNLIYVTNTSLIFFVDPQKTQTNYVYKLHLIGKLFLFILHVTCHFRSTIFYTAIWPNLLNNVITLAIHFITTIFITAMYITSTISNNKYNIILRTINEIDHECQLPIKYYERTKHYILTYFIWLFGAFLMMLFEPIINIIQPYRMEYPFEFYVLLWMPMFSTIVYTLNFTCFVHMLQVRFEEINMRIECNKLKCGKELLFTLRGSCHNHLRLCEVTRLINDAFGVALMLNIAVFFTHFLGNTFMMLHAFQNAQDLLTILPNMLLSVWYMTPAGLMFWEICYRCAETEYQVIFKI